MLSVAAGSPDPFREHETIAFCIFLFFALYLLEQCR